MATVCGARVRGMTERFSEVIRIDAAWFAVELVGMCAGVDTALARLVNVLIEARARHAYLVMKP